MVAEAAIRRRSGASSRCQSDEREQLVSLTSLSHQRRVCKREDSRLYARIEQPRQHTKAVRKRGAASVLAFNMPAYLRPVVHRNTIQFRSVPLDTARRAWGILLSTDARDRLKRALAAGPVRLRVVVAATSPISALSDPGVPHTIETYRARHGWVPNDTPVPDAAETERHWRTLFALLHDTLGAGPV